MSGDGGPPFHPARTEEIPPRVRNLEDWASRHDVWSHHAHRALREDQADQGHRMTALEARVQRALAAIGGMRLKWGIVAWVVGTALSAFAAWLAAR